MDKDAISQFISNLPEVIHMDGDKRTISADDPEELNPGMKYSGDAIFVVVPEKDSQQIEL